MKYTAKEVLQFTRENDVKFIRLAFSDIYGALRNLSIMPTELEKAFNQGIVFDATAISGFGRTASSLVLKPDPTTLSILPWRPTQGRVIRMFCHIYHEDGTPFSGDFRRQLVSAIDELASYGLHASIGLECEFYLFELDDKGYATTTPHDRAGYFDIAPRDRGENVRRDICLTLETMGLLPETSHHERGPGQHEISLKYVSPLDAADQFLTFKSVVKMVAERNGLHASFMPKPLKAEHGNGMHINLSLYRSNENLYNANTSQQVHAFTQGILGKLPELSLFTNPLTNSYARLRAQLSKKLVEPDERSWLRLLTGHGDASRIELRSPDPSLNPYIVFTLMLRAGMAALEAAGENDQPINAEMRAKALDLIPTTLKGAIQIAEQSSFLSKTIPYIFLEDYFDVKRNECMLVEESTDHYVQEISHYFDTSIT
ncbi:MAG: glutamine synthetase [Clostridiales bacterium]|jgi:glutamine synthetase|nr:glutamine synthetase [Clostridiales bacterium]